MKALLATLSTHLAGEETTLCTCLKITRQDSTVFGFTDLDEDLTISAQVYKSTTGYSRTAVEHEANLSVPHITLGGLIGTGSGDIKESDILNRKFDGAAVEIFQVNFEDLTQGSIPLLLGTMGRVSPKGQGYTAELVGLSRRLDMAPIVETYTQTCLADLGDARCGESLTTYTGTVDVVTSRRQFTSTARPSGSPAAPIDTDSAFFDLGKLTWTSGDNNGLSMEVRSYTDATKTFVLPIPMPNTVTAGDTFSIVAGCDKSFATCKSRFDNIVNFRGFPHIPTGEKTKIPLDGQITLGGAGYPSNH